MYYIGLDVHNKTISYCVKMRVARSIEKGRIVLLFRRGDGTQHQWVRYSFTCSGVRKQVVIDPSGED